MWAGIVSLALKLLGVFFPEKSKEKVAHDDGVIQGAAQQKAASESAVLKDVKDAKEASDAVDAGVSHGVPVSESDGFRRD